MVAVNRQSVAVCHWQTTTDLTTPVLTSTASEVPARKVTAVEMAADVFVIAIYDSTASLEEGGKPPLSIRLTKYTTLEDIVTEAATLSFLSSAQVISNQSTNIKCTDRYGASISLQHLVRARTAEQPVAALQEVVPDMGRDVHGQWVVKLACSIVPVTGNMFRTAARTPASALPSSSLRTSRGGSTGMHYGDEAISPEGAAPANRRGRKKPAGVEQEVMIFVKEAAAAFWPVEYVEFPSIPSGKKYRFLLPQKTSSGLLRVNDAGKPTVLEGQVSNSGQLQQRWVTEVVATGRSAEFVTGQPSWATSGIPWSKPAKKGESMGMNQRLAK